jgi:hypothetical protein
MTPQLMKCREQAIKIQLVQRVSGVGGGRETSWLFTCIVGLCNPQTWQEEGRQADKHDTIWTQNILSHWFYWAELPVSAHQRVGFCNFEALDDVLCFLLR